jgi:hypothetical protein
MTPIFSFLAMSAKYEYNLSTDSIGTKGKQVMVVSMFFGKKNGDYCENKSCTGID